MTEKQGFMTALYERLSRDDELNGESNCRRPRTLRTCRRRHHRHARLNRTRHRANRTHRSARHETTHHGRPSS